MEKKRIIGMALAAAMSLSITACSSFSDNASVSSDGGKASPKEMPVLSITTADGKNSFATDPVNEYVSGQIATWTPGYVMPPAPYYADCTVTLTDGDKETVLDGAEAQVKVRGNWTTNYEKKPLRIKFAEKHSMLGMNDGGEYKNWVLLAEYKDASMLRNKAALDIAGELLGADGYYASDAEFVEVNINGEYWGVYLLAEQQQVNGGRVDITTVPKEYTGTDIGYFLEFDGNYFLEDELHRFYVDYHDNADLKPYDGAGGSGKLMRCEPIAAFDPKKEIGFSIKSDINSAEQRDFIAVFTNNAFRIMYEAAYNNAAYVLTEDCSDIVPAAGITPEEAVRRVVDVQSLADMYIISELTCDADLYWSSFFMSADFGADGNGLLTFHAPWDFDSALGNKSRCPDGTGFYAANIIPDVNSVEYETINPWLAVLMYEDWYQDIIRSTWTKAYDGGVFSRGISSAADITERFSDAFARNEKRWGVTTKNSSVTGELSPDAAKCGSQKEAAEFLETWLTTRVDFMNSHWHS